MFSSGDWRILKGAVSATIMQPGTKKFLRFLQSWVINTFAVLVAVIILRSHIGYAKSSPWPDSDSALAALLLGILNAFVRPILMLSPCRC